MIITTSWDDGHPSDQRLADLLSKYGLPATFYIPKSSQRPTLNAKEVKAIANRFEVAAHTMDHLALTTLSPQEANRQIRDSKAWIEQATSQRCIMFCPPLGKFRREHVRMIEAHHYKGFRTVEMGSVNGPASTSALMEMPTTVQAHPHGSSTYLKNAVRRYRIAGAWRAVQHWPARDWLHRADFYLQHAMSSSGVFHLWGHSWEIDENDQWVALEVMFGKLSQLLATGKSIAMTNGAVCELKTPKSRL